MASEILCKCAEFDNIDPSEKQSFDRLKFEHYVRHGPTRPVDGFTVNFSGRAFRSEW